MSSVAIQGNASGTGVITVASPNTNSSYTVSLPAATTTLVGTDATQTLTNKTLTSPTLTTPNIDSAQFATVSGTAPIYGCRAWVNFNGTGVVAIRASGNVSSITDNGVGDYTVNFTTAMSDANYATCVNSTRDAGYPIPLINTQATGSVRINTTQFNASVPTAIDTTITNVAVFR
jgi:hypothetical protein